MQTVIRSGAIVIQAKPWPIIGPYNESLLEALFPSIRFVGKVMVSLAFVALLVGLAKARFYLPDNPVAINFSTLGVLAMGGFLGWRWGLFSFLVYYFLGMAGLSVFQGGGGWHYLSSGPTGGYLIGFIASAWLVGYLMQHGWHRGRVLWAMLLGGLILYLPALLWLYTFDFEYARGQIFAKGMYPFIPGDLVKVMLASLAAEGGWVIADHLKRSRQQSSALPKLER